METIKAATMNETNTAVERMSSQEWLILLICFLTTTFIAIPYYGHATQWDTMMEKFGLNYTQMGMLDSVTAFSAGIVLLFGGMLTYRWGARNVSILGMLVAAIGQLGFAYMNDYSGLILMRLVQGAGIALVYVGPYAMVLRWFEDTKHLGFALGVMIACDGAGALLALYLFAYVLAGFGWVTGVTIGAAALGILAVVTFLFLKEPDKWYKAKEEHIKNPIPLGKELKEIFLNRNVFSAIMMIIPVWGVFGTAVYWVPAFLMEDAGWSETTSGLVGSAFACAGMLAFIFGMLSDRSGKRMPLTVISCIGSLVAFALLTVFYIRGNFGLVSLMLAVAGFFMYCGLLLVYYLVADAIGSIRSAAANGLIMCLGYLIGGFVYPVAVGYFKDLTGSYTSGFIAITVSILLFSILVILSGKDTPKEIRPE
ncbi:MFS transporter [Desulforhopalus singaporensis]|uniref:Sugar phosphate permease n=1 Tax=Desulforhopalus singaporensis TaxID=91360 RepID=A0A1H0V8R8_9BACT|nr:MFS transporter [Desulforhopalus singaporensis]SDP74781.1 Sugar phosphate permease [Desulforhopalus singaporensis]